MEGDDEDSSCDEESYEDARKHICPHRKKGQPPIGDGQHTELCTEYQSRFADLPEGTRTQRKQWATSAERVREIYKSYLQKGDKENAVESPDQPRLVPNKGNGRNPLTTLGNSSWSSKQVPKTMLLKRADNLKAEGAADFTTTHQQDFTQKKAEASPSSESQVAPAPVHPSMESRKDSWSNRHIPKTMPIKRPDNLKPLGPLEFSTTHRKEYTGKMAEQSLAPETMKAQTAKQNDLTPVKVEGWQGIAQVPKTQSYKRPDNLQLSGSTDFNTVQQRDFTKKQQTTTKTSMRPQTSLKPGGEFRAESSYLDAYTPRKAEQIKDQTSLKIEGRSSYFKPEGATESTTTTQPDYSPRRAKKASETRPKSSLKLEGKMLDESMTQAEFKRWGSKRSSMHRPHGELKLEGKMQMETTSGTDYERKATQKMKPLRPPTSIKPSGAFEKTTLNQDVYKPHRAERVKTLKQDTTYKFEGPFQGESTLASDFKGWQAERPFIHKPQDNIKQDGDMEFTTTTHSDFSPRKGHPQVRGEKFKPGTGPQLFTEPLTSETTMDADYKRWSVAKPDHTPRPEDNLEHDHIVGFNFSASNKAKDLEKPDARQQKLDFKQDGDMEFTTTTHSDFSPRKGHPQVRGEKFKPGTGPQLFTEPLTSETTMDADYKRWSVAKPDHTPRPEDNLEHDHIAGFNFSASNKAKDLEKPDARQRNLDFKQDGDMEFTTTTHSDFSPRKGHPQVRGEKFKPGTGPELFTEPLTSETTMDAVYKRWNVAKPDHPRPEDNLEHDHIAGFNFSASNKAMDPEKTAHQLDTRQQKVEKMQNDAKQDTISKSDGPFQGESTEFKGWQVERPFIHKPQDNIKQDGDMEFTTTTHSDFSPRKGHPQVRGEKFKPGTGPQLFTEPLTSETTMDADYKRWSVAKPDHPRPEDNLEHDHIAGFNFSASNKAMDPDKSSYRQQKLEKIDAEIEVSGQEENALREQKKIDASSHEDFKPWKMSKPVKEKPINNLKQEGEFDFSTTHTHDYVKRGGKRAENLRPASSLVLRQNSEENDSEKWLMGRVTKSKAAPAEERTKPGKKKTAADEQLEISSPIDDKQILETSEDMERKPVEMKDGMVSGSQQPALVSVEATSSDPQVSNEVEHGIHSTSNYEREMDTIKEDETEYVEWDQIRPKPIRPRNNLRQEGGMDFSTTTQQEYVQRPIDRVHGLRPKTSTQITGDFEGTTTNQIMYPQVSGGRMDPIRPRNNLHTEKGTFNDETTSGREFQNWHVDKPLAIRPVGTLRQEGDMNFRTTHHDEFQEKKVQRVSQMRPKTTNRTSGDFEGITTNQVMHPIFKQDKVESIRPKPNLKTSSASFVGETTTNREFQNWGVDKPSPIIPKGTMKQEGDMDFTTMNQIQFDGKQTERVSQIRPHTSSKITGDFDGTTTNQVMFQSVPIEKVHEIRPKGNIRKETGDFENETTANREFQQWEYSKTAAIRPKNNLHTEGELEFTTTSQADYGEKRMDRVSKIRPKTAAKITGDFEGTTTNQAMFQTAPIEKVHEIRPHTNIQLERGDFANDTTTNREFQQWGYSKPNAIVPKGNIRQEGDLDFTTTNQREFDGKQIDKVAQIRPKTSSKITGEFEGTTTNQVMFQNVPGERAHEIRPQGNITLEKGEISNETTTNREFQQWNFSKQAPIIPKGNLTQEGSIDFTTTNQTQFEKKPIQRVGKIRPHTAAKLTGDFEGTTTNQVMYQAPVMDKVHDIRPRDNLHTEPGSFDGKTTTQNEFAYRPIERTAPVKPRSNLRQEGEIDFTTSNNVEFEEKPIHRVSKIRPSTAEKTTGDFVGTTTNQEMFQAPAIEMVHGIRPKTTLYTEKAKLDEETTTNKEFQKWQMEKPTAILPVTTLKQEGDMQFATTNQTEYFERKGERAVQIRPKTSNKLEGDFEGTTTNQAMFHTHPVEKAQPIRQQNNLELEKGKFSDETTTGREYRQWVKSRPPPSMRKSKQDQSVSSNQATQPKTQATKVKVSPQHKGKRDDTDPETKPRTSRKSFKPQDHQFSEGTPFMGNTTTQSTYKGQSSERVKSIKPKGNLGRDSMPFVGESTSKAEYRPWQIYRADQVSHQEPLRQEGGMEFATTSGEEFVSKQANRVKGIRPQPTNKLSGEIDNETTNNKFYNTHSIEKMKPILPRNNIKTGNAPFTFETTTGKAFPNWVEKRSKVQMHSDAQTSEEMREKKTIKSDYGTKPVARVKAIRPVENLKQEGTMEFSTTTQSEFKEKPLQKTKKTRPKSSTKLIGDFDSTTINQQMFKVHKPDTVQSIKPVSHLQIESTPFADDTTTKRDYEPWQLATESEAPQINVESDVPTQKPAEVPVKPRVHIRGKRPAPNGKISADMDTATTTQVCYRAIPSIRPPKRFKPDDNLKTEKAPFEGDTTTGSEFKNWKASRSSPKKRSPSLKQEGSMQFSTTTTDDFSGKLALQESNTSKRKPVKPQGSLKQTGDMEFSTTTNSSYVGNTTPKTKNLRPKSTLKIGGASPRSRQASPISSRTSSPPSSVRQTDTTTRAAYAGLSGERTPMNRPPTSQKVGGAPFEGQTTSKSSFTTPPDNVQRTHLYKPESHHILDGGKDFYGNTTYRCSFDALKGNHCPVIDIDADHKNISKVGIGSVNVE